MEGASLATSRWSLLAHSVHIIQVFQRKLNWVVPENIRTSPTEGIGNSRGVGGGGSQRSRKFLRGEGVVSIIYLFFPDRPVCSIFVCLHFAPQPRKQK